MASIFLSEQSKEDNPNFTLKNVGKFWILKTKNTSKRLVFLDNAKDVDIIDNIIIADEKLFEIHNNENGVYRFIKLEDVTYDTYFSMGKSLRGNSEIKKEMFRKREEGKYESQQVKTVDEELYEAVSTLVMSESDKRTKKYDQRRHSDTQMECSYAERNSLSEVQLTPEYADEEYFENGHEEDNSFEFGSAEAEDDIDVVQMPSTTSEGKEFEVEIEQLDLGKKMCGMEGRVILLIQDKGIVLKNSHSQSEKYIFPFNWIRRFAIVKSYKFSFEIGRKCPIGEGYVHCITAEAKQILKACILKMNELNKRKKNTSTSWNQTTSGKDTLTTSNDIYESLQ